MVTAKRKGRTVAKDRGTVTGAKMVRAVYDPAMREAIKRGEVDEMKRLLRDAKALYRDQGDLKTAIGRLERAIRRLR